MLKLAVIADDFTGALDTGVQFAKNDIPTQVILNMDAVSASDDDKQVLVIDTESRHLRPELAYKKVYEAVRFAMALGAEHIYKKTDSTLRGNVGSELSAAMDASGEDALMFIPAFPQNGRITVGGVSYVDGVALMDTVYARDPIDPVKSSDIAQIIALQTDKKVFKHAQWGTDTGRGGIHVFDASTDEDLRIIAGKLKDTGGLRLTAGCAGFAAALAGQIEFEREKLVKSINDGPVLIVSGSVNTRSIEQAAYAKSLGYGLQKILLERISSIFGNWCSPRNKVFCSLNILIILND